MAKVNPPRGRPCLVSHGVKRHQSVIEPRGDIKARLSRVNREFMMGNLDHAIRMVFEIIRINAETVQAWNTLASIFNEKGDYTRALMAMVYAAHLQPKNVLSWLQCADLALSLACGDVENERLYTARLCYAAAVRAEPNNMTARLGKAVVCHRQGHIASAISDYILVLREQIDLRIVRKFSEACIEPMASGDAAAFAINAYRCILEGSHQGFEADADIVNNHPEARPVCLNWLDAGTYAELFASLGKFVEAISGLKAIARMIVGRVSDHIWDQWDIDDREWDVDSVRRDHVAGFSRTAYDIGSYGEKLPLELRARLAAYRLALRNRDEALRHLHWLPSDLQATETLARRFPFLLTDIADRLAASDDFSMARDYYTVLLQSTESPDPLILLKVGKCYGSEGDAVSAEEFFLAAIDADYTNVEARVELAGLYEIAREDEEAMVIATEAMLLEEARHIGNDIKTYSGTLLEGMNPRRRGLLSRAILNKWSGRRVMPESVRRRYRPRRLGDPEARQTDEAHRDNELVSRYQLVLELKARIKLGENSVQGEWAFLVRDVIDEFRSLRQFYSWERYLKFHGALATPSVGRHMSTANSLSQMVERLSKSKACYGLPKATILMSLTRK
jgi:general transcription factor 3C polypeptide 3 (transcription factor C subunit 4)